MQTIKSHSIKDIIVFSGAIIAFHIGSGFASGQEIIQFFSVYGTKKSSIALAICFVIFTASAYFIFSRFKTIGVADTKNCYPMLCTKYIGKIFAIITPILLFFIYIVMLSGTGETLKQFFGMPSYIGRIIIAVCVLATVAGGLNGVVNIIGRLGTIIIVLVFLLGLFGFLHNPQGLSENFYAVPKILPQISSSFFVAALLYSGFSVVTGVVFLCGLSLKIKNKKQGFFIALLGNGGFVLAALILNYGILANFSEVSSYQIPALYLAILISQKLAILFVFVLFAGAYTTAVPMLWSITASLEKVENKQWHTIFCVMLTLVAIVAGNMPFDKLLGIVYPAIGALGLILFVDMLAKAVLKLK